MGSPTIYYYCPEDPFKCLAQSENKPEFHATVTRSLSTSSSSCPSPASSSCEEYEESDTEFHAEPSKRKIKRKLRARDRDQEIEFLLKRRSLVLQRLSSNASTGSSSKCVTFLNNNDDEETNYNNPSTCTKRSLSRQTSNTSVKSVRFFDCEDVNHNHHHQHVKRVLSRQSSNASVKSSRSVISEHETNQHAIIAKQKFLSRQSSVSSMNSESSNCSSSSSASCDNNPHPSSRMETKANYYQSVAKLAKNLRSNCDKILDMSVPFVIDSNLLWTISDAINDLLSNNQHPSDDDDAFSQSEAESTASIAGSLGGGDRRANHELDCMFITDFFGQTPSLCIVLSETSTIRGTIDITLFRSLQFLELRKIPVHMVAGINTIRVNLKKLKCTRCIDSLNEVFLFNGEQTCSQPTPSTSSSTRQHKSHASHSFDFPSSAQQHPSMPTYSAALTTLTSVWPELREIDVSFNRIEYLDTKILELTPSVEILNLSRNRISSIDSSFTRVLNCLTFLNLNYNQLTSIPPLPPNLKILLLSNNYISHLVSPLLSSNFKSLEILDLSQNVISDEQQLESFHNLSSLVSLSLIGNPISYSDSYRATVSANLHRAVLNNKQFVLDKKKLSNSDVRHAMEQIKKRRPLLNTGAFISTYSKYPSESSRFNEIKSLTQSYDSNSSSIRSACRKKAKIREVVVLDDDSDDENIENIQAKSVAVRRDLSPLSQPRRGTLERKSSHSSYKSIDSIGSDDKPTLQETKIAIESLREKYGPENWLIRQGGCEVKKLLGISDHHLKPRNGRGEADLFSKSLPPQASTNTSFYSAVTNWDVSSYDGSNSNSSPQEFQHQRPQGVPAGEEYNSSSSTIAELTNSLRQNPLQLESISDESIKCVDDVNNSSESGLVYYSCTTLDESSKVGVSSDPTDIDFDNFGSKSFANDSPVFRFFQNGQIFNLIIEGQYLYEVDPRQAQNVVSWWDLKSIKSMSQEKCSNETETVEFRIYFDTLKKNKKERSFVMTRNEYKEFEKLVEPYLQQNTMEEFSDGFQCIKCNAQFSKCLLTVKMIDKTPVQIQVCPNIECQSDLLIPLESIPLPNNESLNIGDTATDSSDQAPEKVGSYEKKSTWGQLPFMRTSTPVSETKTRGSGIPQSLPTSSFMADFFKSPLAITPKLPLTRTSKSSHVTSPTVPVSTSPSSSSDHSIVPATNNNFAHGDELTAANTNAKSDSDVEVLSCDSSSIEVLGQNDGNESEVEVEEALEMFMPDNSGQFRKLSAITAPVMTESNSSGSFAESVCTTYEKVLGTSTSTTNAIGVQLSQQLTPTSHLSVSTSASTSASSISSSATMTPTHSTTSPALNAIMPIKYDYQDFTKIDHRLQLFCEITVFKSRDEELLALTKALVLTPGCPYMAVVIISNKKVYFYKITGNETEKPETWLQKKDCLPLNKLQRLDVLIGRHGVGMDFQTGKYLAIVFRDSTRTQNFFEFFLCDICTKIDPPIVQDIGQVQKALVSSSSPVSYFGMLRLAVCETTSKSYAVSAIVLTDDNLRIVADMSWLIDRTGNETAITKHEQPLKRVRQVECLEMDATFVRIVFQLEGNKYVNWELCFETKEEQDTFTTCLQSQVKDVPFISLSQPLEP